MSSKSPELLARYCDLLLKKSSKNPEEAELEDTLNQVVGDVMTVHQCIREQARPVFHWHSAGP